MQRKPSARTKLDKLLLQHVRASHERSGETYGVRRIWPDVRDAGFQMGRERFARVMREAGIAGHSPRRRLPVDQGERPVHPLAANILNRDFTADAPNRRWVADFTYVWTRQGWLYVATVFDLFSRRIVGWSMQSSMTADLVISALGMAIWRRGVPKELIHHSDQGSQYTGSAFQKMLADLGIQCSLSRRGECHDNAVMESFYGTMKTERLSRMKFKTRDAARQAVFEYIEGFYNPHRRHSTLGNISPMAFEKQAMCA